MNAMEREERINNINEAITLIASATPKVVDVERALKLAGYTYIGGTKHDKYVSYDTSIFTGYNQGKRGTTSPGWADQLRKELRQLRNRCEMVFTLASNGKPFDPNNAEWQDTIPAGKSAMRLMGMMPNGNIYQLNKKNGSWEHIPVLVTANTKGDHAYAVKIQNMHHTKVFSSLEKLQDYMAGSEHRIQMYYGFSREELGLADWYYTPDAHSGTSNQPAIVASSSRRIAPKRNDNVTTADVIGYSSVSAALLVESVGEHLPPEKTAEPAKIAEPVKVPELIKKLAIQKAEEKVIVPAAVETPPEIILSPPAEIAVHQPTELEFKNQRKPAMMVLELSETQFSDVMTLTDLLKEACLKRLNDMVAKLPFGLEGPVGIKVPAGMDIRIVNAALNDGLASLMGRVESGDIDFLLK